MSGRLSRREAIALLAATAAMGGAPALAVPRRVDREVRFGLTAVVVRENIRFFDRWRAYLESRIGRGLRFVQRRSYREIMELLETGDLDFAWICGYPYVQARGRDILELVAVPVFEGAPLYRSYIIVADDSGHGSLAELRGGVFAFSDPDSNSGYLVPRAMLARMGENPEDFFRVTFFTYNHAETVQAVAARVADGGAVDSYVWEYLARKNPGLAGRTRVIGRSGLYGFPPVVARRSVGGGLFRAMRGALLAMKNDPEGQVLLNDLALDGFGVHDPAIFDGIRDLTGVLARAKG